MGLLLPEDQLSGQEMFSKPGLPMKMTANNNTFGNFKVLHIYYFILSSQLYETAAHLCCHIDDDGYYYHN